MSDACSTATADRHSRWRRLVTGLLVMASLTACGLREEVNILSFHVESESDDRVLVVVVDSCEAEPQVAAEENEEAVTLTATAKSRPFGGPACTEADVVELQDPLAGRQVLNGTTGEEVNLQEP